MRQLDEQMPKLRIAFIVEQILGHRTHYKNLQHYVAQDTEIDPVWIPIEPWARDIWQKLPVVKNNWTLLSSLRARSALAMALKEGSIDLIYFHTQVMMLGASKTMRQIPTVASLDATPIGMDSLDAGYGERRRNANVEWIKNSVNGRSLNGCRHVFAWSDWVARSLAENYRIDPAKISVLPPGIDLAAWQTRTGTKAQGERVRLLFVGGEFQRKGGDVLMKLFRESLSNRCQLDIVTGPDSTGAEGVPHVNIHRGLKPNTDALRSLYQNADIFVLPTRGDCMPWVVLEAAAAGLPVVTTRLGAIPEMVNDGVTGFVVQPGDEAALRDRLLRLITDDGLRQRMGAAGRAAMERRYDGDRNYELLLQELKRCSCRQPENRLIDSTTSSWTLRSQAAQ